MRRWQWAVSWSLLPLLGLLLAGVWAASLAAKSAGPAAPAAGSFRNWKPGLGKWSLRGEVYAQTDGRADCRSFAPLADWTDYTYEVRARKTGGAEGFLILFRVKDREHFYWWNIGGWSNSRHALETRPRREGFPSRPGRLKTGTWYDVKVDVRGPRIRCYLDGKLIHDVKRATYPAGGIGLGTWSTQVEYRDVRVTAPDGRRLYGTTAAERAESAVREIGQAGSALRGEIEVLRKANAPDEDPRWQALYRRADAIAARFRRARERIQGIDLPAQRKAVEALVAKYPRARDRGQAMLRRIAEDRGRLATLNAALARGEEPAVAQAERLGALDRQLTSFRQSLYVTRCPPVAFIKRQARGRNGTNATMHSHGTGVGSAICIYDPAHPEKGARTIFEDKEGFIFDMSPSYDARKILFAYKKEVRKRQDSLHVYEINVDGTGLRQLTKGRYHDFGPVYLPDGRICFVSTRVESYSLCQDFIACSLFVMNADGSDIRRIEYNTLCAITPSVRGDGSILYTRWEYQDKNIFCTEGLWTVYPDGTKLALYYGNTLTVPNGIYGARQIPGTDKVICVMAAHHFPPLGGIAIVDRRLGLENPDAMKTLTPDVPYRPTVGRTWKEANWGPGDRFYPWSYTDPWPIDRDLFLVSYGGPLTGGPQRYRLYLMDDEGNKVPLYEDPETSCYNALPLRPRPRPHRLPGVPPRQARGEGRFFVSDVYQGLLDKGVRRGDVKALRVCSQEPKKYNTEGPRYHDHYPIIGYGSYYTKISYGTVPVTPAGSAYFTAPAGVELYFEALDASGKEIRRMGTVTQLADGESQSCVGCHESRFLAVPNNPAARERLKHPPDTITPPSWGAVPIDFVKHVQPVFDKHCVRCHAGRAPKAGMDLSGDKNRFFNMAYKSLIDRRLVDFYYINPGPTGNFPPLKTGSRVSKLVKK
ncbi:MAG TPA: family 16 glycoside hydrolase, partial [Phycisphaerae bacterium]|nr:family 16 glycoside hydrolase [Phycisphaerae bacterium]